ncbi:MAG: YCF48-related protein, partial [Pirellulaceae bacterium]|nr:YCF48-related protein [Pirellulaceae bacterium]
MLRSRNTLNLLLRLCVLLVASTTPSVAHCHSQTPQDVQSPRRTDLQYQPPTAQSRPSILQPIHNNAPESPLTETKPPLPVTRLTVSNPAGPLPVNDRQLLMSPGHLNDIAFVDAQTGVAIGNQGVIWRTSDGGRRWSAVRTEWTGDLHSLVFADAKNGWIVGGRALPIRGLHEGVVLRTKDGGVTWRQLSSTLLTKLTRIGYDHKHKKLWAVGEPDGQFPAGLYESFDLGQNWNDVTPKLDANNSSQPARDGGSAMATVSAEPSNSAANIGLCVGEEWIVSNRLGIFRCVGDRAAPVTISAAPNTVPTNSRELRFQVIRTLGNRLAALGSDGKLYLSSNRGQKWEPAAALPDEIDATKFRLLATSGESLWLAARVDQQLYHFNNQTQQWSCQTLPAAAQLNSIYFADERSGWIVGTNGQVWSTQDGGTNWQCLHRTQSGIAILLLAATAEDIPQELVAHLAVNQGLQVGVLCGRTEISRGVCEQAFWQNEVASLLVDPLPFDPQQPSEQTVVRIRRYLDSLQPRVILVCPPTGSLNQSSRRNSHLKFQVQAPLWLDAAQQQRTSGVPCVAVIATLSNGNGETSISSQALATNVGQLLDDVAWQSKTLIDTWRGDDAQTGDHRVPKTWGIRRLALLEPVDMSWVQPQTG